MKYKFEVTIYFTYTEKDIEVEVELTDKEVTRIKKLVAEDCEARKIAEKELEEDDFLPKQCLLEILDNHDPKLFEKFWNVIFPPVFVEILISDFEENDAERHEDDNFRDYHKADFDKLYEMYGDTLEIDYHYACLCKIPEDWMP